MVPSNATVNCRQTQVVNKYYVTFLGRIAIFKVLVALALTDLK